MPTETESTNTLICSKCGYTSHFARASQRKRVIELIRKRPVISFLIAYGIQAVVCIVMGSAGVPCGLLALILLCALVAYKMELLGGRKCPNCGKRNTLVELDHSDGQKDKKGRAG